MTSMMAALHDGNGAMKVTQVPTPEVDIGDALVRVRRTGICGSDLLWYGENRTAESIPGGHEVAGEIVEVGQGVDRARIGDRVAVETIGHGLACGLCWYCRIGQFRQCLDKAASQGGGFADHIVRRAFGCYTMPADLSWDEGALVEPFAVSIHATRRGEMRGGETVAVLGAGNIGLTAVAAARTLGAGQVLASARHQHQADMARRLGADDALTSQESFREAVLDATDGRGADLTIETVGGSSDSTIKQSIDVTRMQGRIVILGGFHAPITLDWLDPLLKEQSIIFSSCYSVLDGRHDYEIAIELMASGRIQLKQMVTHRFGLQAIQQGFDTAYDKSSGSIKVQLQFEE